MPATIHKIDVDRLKTKAEPLPDRIAGQPYTDRVEHGFNVYWCDDNPALFGKAIQQALLECPPDKWNVVIKPAYMPGETWSLVATRKPT